MLNYEREVITVVGVLVLDATWRPLDFINEQKAITLCLLGKATVLAEYEDKVYHSQHLTIKVPKVISLKVYVPLSEKATATVTKRILHMRDENTCQYCGKHKDELPKGVIMTKDHVIPISRTEGKTREERYNKANVWENVVLACQPCNNKKGNHLPEEVGMKLLNKPQRPKGVTMVLITRADDEQKKYIMGTF